MNIKRVYVRVCVYIYIYTYIHTHMYTVSKNHCFTFIDNLYYLYCMQVPEEKGIQTSNCSNVPPRLLQDLDGALHTECRGKGNKSQRPERAKCAKRWGLQSGPNTFSQKTALFGYLILKGYTCVWPNDFQDMALENGAPLDPQRMSYVFTNELLGQYSLEAFQCNHPAELQPNWTNAKQGYIAIQQESGSK